MTDPYVYETYAGREGETFRIVLEDRAIDSTLRSAQTHSPGVTSGFTLVFVAPGDVLPQATYTFDHDELGLLDLFVVPVGRDETGVSYEAVFNAAP